MHLHRENIAAPLPPLPQAETLSAACSCRRRISRCFKVTHQDGWGLSCRSRRLPYSMWSVVTARDCEMWFGTCERHLVLRVQSEQAGTTDRAHASHSQQF